MSKDQPTYSRKRQELLRALVGGLSTDDYHEFAESRKSLHVRVKVLRNMGYTITNNAPLDKSRKVRPVVYRLTDYKIVETDHPVHGIVSIILPS